MQHKQSRWAISRDCRVRRRTLPLYNVGTAPDGPMDNQEAAGDITQLLRAWGSERGGIPEELLHLTYERLRHLAGACMRRERPGHTLQPTALVNELYLR